MITTYFTAALMAVSPPIAIEEPVAKTCAPGIYAVARGSAPIALSSVKADHRKVTNMMGAMLLGPLGGNKLKVKTVVTGVEASTKLRDLRPEFYFCFASQEPTGGTSSDYVGVTTAASPQDYRLVRFDQANNQRELTLASAGGFGGPKAQVSKATVAFKAEEVAPGQFRVTLPGDLAAGQYGFLYALSTPASARKKDTQEQVYDFAVIN